MSKQDQTYPRTAAHLAREYNFGKSFAEIRGVALDAQTHAYNAEKAVSEWSQRVESDFSDIYAELNMRVETDENDNLIGKIHIGANQLTIDTDNFTLDENGNVEIEGVIRAKQGGSIGTWDISAKSIFKATSNYMVQIAAPEAESDYVFSVAKIDNGEVKDMPFYLMTDGLLYSSNAILKNSISGRSVQLNNGVVRVDGLWKAYDDQMMFLLLVFVGANDEEVGLFAYGKWDWDNFDESSQTMPFIYQGMKIEPLTEADIGNNTTPWL